MISFVIRTKNEEKRIEEVIQSILSQKNCGTPEIIIVDSGSTDHTLDIAKQYGCKVIQIKPEEFTWGYALNVGIASSEYRIIGVISGHCVLDGSSVCERSMEYLCSNNVDVVYGRQVGEISVDPFEMYKNNISYPKGGLHLFQKEPVFNTKISNAFCFFKKELWDIVKFDETARSCEDAIWAKEIQEKGYSLAYSGDISVIHSHQFDVEYTYRKEYWREYEKGEDYQPKNSMYYCLRNLVKWPVLEFFDYYFGMKKLEITVNRTDIFLYVMLINLAKLNANLDYIKGRNNLTGYSEIHITPAISRIQSHRFSFLDS